MTASRSPRRPLWVAALGLAAVLAAPLARAGDVYWSIGATAPGVVVGVSNARPVYVQPAPVYVPPPMYVYPQPVYTPPRVVYPGPQVVYVQPATGWVPPGHRWHHRHERHGHGDGRGHGHGHGHGHDRHGWRH